jgi:hypothetical protein
LPKSTKLSSKEYKEWKDTVKRIRCRYEKMGITLGEIDIVERLIPRGIDIRYSRNSEEKNVGSSAAAASISVPSKPPNESTPKSSTREVKLFGFFKIFCFGFLFLLTTNIEKKKIARLPTKPTSTKMPSAVVTTVYQKVPAYEIRENPEIPASLHHTASVMQETAPQVSNDATQLCNLVTLRGKISPFNFRK